MEEQLKQLSDRELLEGIYIMLSKVLHEIKDDQKDLGINMLANVLADRFIINKKIL